MRTDNCGLIGINVGTRPISLARTDKRMPLWHRLTSGARVTTEQFPAWWARFRLPHRLMRCCSGR